MARKVPESPRSAEPLVPGQAHVVVVDLEATCWEPEDDPALAANQGNECEIIEIGAVRWGEDEDRFRMVVKPRRHPRLSAFCVRLTGLVQADVDAGVPFVEAYRAFLDWAGGDDGLVLASWGAWDDRQLRREIDRHGLDAPKWQPWNIKRRFARRAKALGAPKGGWMGLSVALEWLDLDFEGTAHRALDDARNAARVLTWAEQPIPDHVTPASGAPPRLGE